MTDALDPNQLSFMRRVFKHLDLSEPSQDEWQRILTRSISNRFVYKPMLPETRQLLSDFYRPWNEKLAELLQDNGFVWT